MKQILLSVLGITALLIIVIFLLPSKKAHTQTLEVECPNNAVTRNIANSANWIKWWPGEKINDSNFVYKKKKIQISIVLLNGFKATTISNDIITTLDFQFSSIGNSSAQFTLNSVFEFSKNPFKKAIQYLSYNKEKEDYVEFMNSLKEHFNSIEKLYGFKIEKQKVPNSSYISTKQSYQHFPTVDEIYSLIDEVNQYILQQKSRAVNFPILNIHTDNNKEFDLMVAIATDQNLASNNKFFLKNMMLGNILVAEVKGGNTTIEQCQQAMKYYVEDYQKSSPAISFQRLITNRLTEKDSTKWVTTINYPIFK